MKTLKIFLGNTTSVAKRVFTYIIRLYKRYIVRDEFAYEIRRWFRDKGDQTLRLDYPELNENSIVFDLGGYMGDFTQAISEKYGCKIYLFEPHPKFYASCVDRFLDNPNVTSLNYGLSDVNGKFYLSDSVDGSSFLNPNHGNKDGIECQLKEFFGALDELDISNIDLMKVNIEGGEYPLLQHIAASDRLIIVKQYQIQFHNFIENAVAMRKGIVEALSKTHKRTWCYTFVWENWRKH